MANVRSRILVSWLTIFIFMNGLSAIAQPAAFQNAIKLNLMPLILADKVVYKADFRRISVEFTHDLKEARRWAWTIDLEWSEFRETKDWVWPIMGVTNVAPQTHIGIHAGVRFKPFSWGSDNQWSLFVEPQIGISQDQLTYFQASVAGESRYSLIHPMVRGRAGLRVFMGRRWSIEPTLEVQRRVVLVENVLYMRSRWVFQCLPELNVGVRF